MTAKGPPRRRALQDHQRKGKVFLPPFVAGLGGYPNVQGHTWHDDVSPELMWIALLYQAAPARSGELARETVLSAKAAFKGSRPPVFSQTSEWSQLSARACVRVRVELQGKGVFRDLAEFLAPLVWLYPECPMARVFRTHSNTPSEGLMRAYVEKIQRAAELLLIRRTRDAAIVQGICVYATVGSGSMSPNGLDLQNLPRLMEYPDSTESRRMESTVRMTTSMLARCCELGVAWRKYFWRHGFTLSRCFIAKDRFHAGAEDAMETAEKLVALFEGLSGDVEREFSDAWEKMPIDLAEPLKSQVLGGLLARQVRYVRHLLITSRLLLGELGEPLLRSMAESAITLAWLVRRGQETDYQRFVLYGLGQEKLALDHLGANPESSVYLEARRQREIAARNEWLQSQRFPYLLSVDVSVSWVDLNVRELAEQAGMIDLYNTVYSPTSAQVHGTWNAIGRTALRFCLNPLHRLHMVPDVETTRIDLMTAVTALRILDRSWEVTREWAKDVPAANCVQDALVKIAAILDAEVAPTG